MRKTDSYSLCISLCIIAAAAVMAWWWKGRQSEPDVSLPAALADSLKAFETACRADSLKRAARYESSSHWRPEPFDPNRDPAEKLLRIGLQPWQVDNMMKYRAKGGIWRSPDDFRRLYGLSEADFQRLRPYLRIHPDDITPAAAALGRDLGRSGKEGVAPAHKPVEKWPEGTVLSLNGADTTQLKGIPGIGSYYASKIVSYRERLGGFVSLSQIDEVEGLPADVGRWFKLEEPVCPRLLRINHADFKAIVRHPYISYEQTKVIVNHIRRFGPLRSWQDLSLYKEAFTTSDITRLRPYISFD